MTLRLRILASVAATIGTLGFGISLLSSHLVLGSFERLERHDSLEQVERADRAFSQMVEEVHLKIKDWSSWDDAYRFMKDGNPAFVKSNMVPGTLLVTQLDTIFFTRLDGRPFKSLSRRGAADAGAIAAALDIGRLRGHPGALRDGAAGFVRVPGGTMLVSIRPVLTSEEKGPPRGWVVFGRAFGPAQLKKLRELTRLNVSVTSLDARSIGSDPALSLVAQKALKTDCVRTLGPNEIAAYSTLSDFAGKPRLLLSIERPRAIYRQGVASVGRLNLLVALAGLALGAVLTLVLERFALSRLAKLSDEVGAIGETMSGASVTVAGCDELSDLARRINEMLASLREGKEQLHDYNANLEKTIQERTAQIQHQALHDSLTGLPNRALFMDRVDSALDRRRGTQRITAVLFVDLDNFKLVNDSQGHSVGDALLVEVAADLQAAARHGDTVARFGGDEFTLLLEDLEDVGEAELVAQRILCSLRNPFRVQGREVFADCSIGIGYTMDPETTAEHLMRKADAAMYRAKSEGKASYMVYDQSMLDLAAERFDLETCLHKALEKGEIAVYYQPLIDLKTGALSGAEALARWMHPTDGHISPGRFIPIAEETGMVVPIGYWILEEACRQAQAWISERGLDRFCMNVNLSGKQLQRSDVVERITEALDRTGLPPSCLKIEITESVLMANQDDVVAKMLRLRALGVRLALDDFGTGYSSLSTLGAFPIDTLKIDQSFVGRLDKEDGAVSIVEAIMALARSMRMSVTGEGVETAAQMRVLRNLGCLTGQGYLFGRPLSAQQFGECLADGDSEAGFRRAA